MRSFNSRGFSLMEMMTVVAVSGVVMMGSVTAIYRMSESSQRIASKSNSQSLAREIQQVTADPTSCKTSIGNLGFALDSNNRMSLSLNSAGTTIAKGAAFHNDGFVVNDFYLDHVRPLGIMGSHDKPMFAADMTLDVQRVTQGAPAMKPQRVGRLYLEVDGANIITCSSRSSMPDLLSATCLQMGGQYASGNCDMSPYQKAVVKRARIKVDDYLNGPYNLARRTEIAANVKTAMDDVAARGKADTAAYTKARMDAVSANLASNLSAVSASNDALNASINSNVANLTNQSNASAASTQSTFRQALSAYQNAVNSYAAAQQANSTAASTSAQVTSASGIAGAAQNNSYSALTNSNAVNGATYNSMNAAIAANSNANATNNAANNALGWANANINYASGVNGYASNVNSYAQSSYGTANNSASYASSASNQSQAAANAAQNAASAASYAAGIASTAAYNANYAYFNPPTINQINTTVVTFIPVNPVPAQTWTWQGILYQTTRNRPAYTYDSVEYAYCTGSACAAPKIQCYFQDYLTGPPTHPVGSTQSTEPTGPACYLRGANDPWIYR